MANPNRRTVTKLLGLSTVCSVPLATVASLLPRVSVAATVVDPASAQAAALQYKEISDTEGASCSVCVLYKGDQAETGPCAIFPGLEVKATALCSAFTPKP